MYVKSATQQRSGAGALDDHGILASLGSTGDAYDTPSRLAISMSLGSA